MRLSSLLAGLVLVVAPVGIATTVDAANAGERAEIARIRMHFDSVLTELRARDVFALSAEQQANRDRLLGTLAAYRARGVFPHNYDFADRAMPYFVDRKTGTLCAVAYLLESTGRRDIVDRVARANNNVWVAELAGDSALARWLDLNGLTLAEAARIQLPYMQVVTPQERARNEVVLKAAPVAFAGAAVTGVWNVWSNRDGHRRSVSWTGLAAGAASTAAGVYLMSRPNPTVASIEVGAASVVIGSVSMFTATYSIFRHRQVVSAEREAERKRAVAEASFTPIVGVSNESRPTVGASLSLKF